MRRSSQSVRSSSLFRQAGCCYSSKLISIWYLPKYLPPLQRLPTLSVVVRLPCRRVSVGLTVCRPFLPFPTNMDNTEILGKHEDAQELAPLKAHQDSLYSLGHEKATEVSFHASLANMLSSYRFHVRFSPWAIWTLLSKRLISGCHPGFSWPWLYPRFWRAYDWLFEALSKPCL